MTAREPTIAAWIPGSVVRPNAPGSRLRFAYGVEADERTLYAAYQLEFEGEGIEHTRGATRVVEIAALPPLRRVESFKDLAAQLGARFAAHPLAGQLPSTRALIEHAVGWSRPLDVAQIAAQSLSLRGASAGLAGALAAVSPNPYRIIGDIRRVARASIAVALGTLELHDEVGTVHGAPADLEELLGELPPYPRGAAIDGRPDVADLVRAHDAQLRAYLAKVAGRVVWLLGLPASQLALRFTPALPGDAFAPSQAFSRIERALRSMERHGDLDVGNALRDLHGQPVEILRPVLVALLSGAARVPLRDGSSAPGEGLDTASIRLRALGVLAASNMDLGAQLDEQAQRERAHEMQRELEAMRRLGEEVRDPDRASARPPGVDYGLATAERGPSIGKQATWLILFLFMVALLYSAIGRGCEGVEERPPRRGAAPRAPAYSVSTSGRSESMPNRALASSRSLSDSHVRSHVTSGDT